MVRFAFAEVALFIKKMHFIATYSIKGEAGHMDKTATTVNSPSQAA
jgi:hypothetical protein